MLILIAINRSPAQPTSPGPSPAPTSPTAGSCPTGLRLPPGAPPTFSNRAVGSDPRRPGQSLVLAAAATTVAPGASLPIYAELQVPASSAGQPNATSSPVGAAATRVTALPCLAVLGASGVTLTPRPPAPASSPQPDAVLSVPASTAGGTALRISATVPAGYPVAGQPALATTLTLRVV